MTGRSKRGNRRASTRARLAVGAAVLAAAGGAAGVLAVAASHGATAAQSAGYTTYHHELSETAALSSAMNGWNASPVRSLSTLSEMTPMATFNLTPFHAHVLAVQRGTVLAAARDEFVVKSSNRTLELWYATSKTKFLNVGGNPTGMTAMTGGTMAVPGHLNMRARSLAKGDVVFVFGEREKGRLVAQLVLFAAPVTPQATSPAATPSMTAAPSMTATPAATAPAPTVTGSAFSGTNS